MVGVSDVKRHSDVLLPEGLYSHESPKMDEIIKDFDWELNRFVEYTSNFTRKETLPIINSTMAVIYAI